MSDLETFAQSRVGTTLLGKYRLERLLGVGGMAAVYQATHRVGNRVAVKVLHPHMSINADVRARFLREGYVANRVEHRGAVRVLDDDTAEDGSVFIAMELLLGETLEAFWRRRGDRLPPREVAELAHQLLDVLAAAHEKGIVHRDIKPENLFLTDGGILKVLDFGIARLANAATPQGATRTGRMLGSPAFMAPEQALGLQRDIDERTDLWSAAATMFTLISGQYVHDAETVEMMLVRAGSRPARSLVTLVPDAPAPIIAVVDRGLEFERTDRWASARAMQAALEVAYLEAFGAPVPGAKTNKPRLALGVTQDKPAAPARSSPSLPPTFDATQQEAPVLQAIAQTFDEPRTEIMPRRPTAASTTAGIEPAKGEPLAALPKARRAFGAMVAGAIVIVAVLVGGLLRIRARSTEDSFTAPSSAAAAGGPSTSASAYATSSVSVSSASGSSSSAPPTVSISDLPSAPSAQPRPMPASPLRGGGGGGTPTPRPAPSPVPAPPPTHAPSCTAVPYYDSQGMEHFREECR